MSTTFEKMCKEFLLPYAAILVLANLDPEEIIFEFLASTGNEELTSLLVEILCSILDKNEKIQRFTFGNDEDFNLGLSAKCAKIFTKALMLNTHISEVIVKNAFDKNDHLEVAKVFADFLKINKSVEILSIANNDIEYSGSLEDASPFNNTLHTLFI